MATFRCRRTNLRGMLTSAQQSSLYNSQNSPDQKAWGGGDKLPRVLLTKADSVDNAHLEEGKISDFIHKITFSQCVQDRPHFQTA